MIDAVSGCSARSCEGLCVTIDLCRALGDIRRASEGTEQAVSCSSQPGMLTFRATRLLSATPTPRGDGKVRFATRSRSPGSPVVHHTCTTREGQTG